MASLKALAARLASQACDYVTLPAEAAVPLQYVFLPLTRDVGPASASLHASWDTTATERRSGRASRPIPPLRPTAAPRCQRTRRTRLRFTASTCGYPRASKGISASPGPPGTSGPPRREIPPTSLHAYL